MFHRDSILLTFGIAGAVVTYLINSPPIPAWDYYEWLKAASMLIAIGMGKLSTSPLPGKAKP